jgi:hypothetical protein
MKKLSRWIRGVREALVHATYHRELKKAELARENSDLKSFKKHVYRAEDAWKKLVLIRENNK